MNHFQTNKIHQIILQIQYLSVTTLTMLILKWQWKFDYRYYKKYIIALISWQENNKGKGVLSATIAWQREDFYLSSCVEVSSQAALRLGSHEQIGLSATCSGFQNAPLSLPNAPVTVANVGLLHSKSGRRPLKCTLIASALFSHTNSSHSTPHLRVPVFMCVCVCLWPLEISMLCALPSLCQDFLRQAISDTEKLWDKDRCSNQHLYKKPHRWIPICVTVLTDSQ